jgi:hypothetical protein
MSERLTIGARVFVTGMEYSLHGPPDWNHRVRLLGICPKTGGVLCEQVSPGHGILPCGSDYWLRWVGP